MSEQKISKLDAYRPPENEFETTDGRRLRSQRSREQIAEALLSLVRSGNLMPRANEIADEAGLSLRTVFRHIEDMESLHRDICAKIEADILPVLLRPYQSSSWREQVFEALSNRIQIYESILPIKLAASLRRFRSDFLMEDYRRFISFERSQLKAILPGAILQDEALFHAIDLAMGFETWRRLRYDNELQPPAAERAIRLMVEKLIAGH